MTKLARLGNQEKKLSQPDITIFVCSSLGLLFLGHTVYIAHACRMDVRLHLRAILSVTYVAHIHEWQSAYYFFKTY